MNDRNVLMRRIQISDFVMNDAALFLDVNPGDEVALEYFHKHKIMREEAAKEYMEKYGPISRSDYNGGPRWKWVDTPWPWQNEEA